jgi:glutamine synthetase
LLSRLDQDDIHHLWVIYTDYNGRSQAKSVPRSRFPSAVAGGIGFAKANLDFNLLDQMVAEPRFGADTGDFFAVPDPATYAPNPALAKTGRVIAWMRDEGGIVWDGCPRTMLARQIDAYAAIGLRLQVAFEPEAYLFRAIDRGEPEPADRTGMFTLAGLETHAALLQEVAEHLEAMGVVVEQVAPEYGPGQIEINIRHAPPLKAADDLVTLRDVLRTQARAHGLITSFMPKPFAEIAGCGLHVHLSLWDLDPAKPASGEADDHPSGLLPTVRGFVAGLLAHAAALTAVGAPTVNSYKRLLPGSWAPAHAAYGIGNRAAFVRIPGRARQRVEVRAGDNACSPYLYLTALLAAGLDGIERQLDPGLPAEGDLGHLPTSADLPLLPRSAHEALGAVEADAAVAAALGPTIFSEWLKVKRSELAAYDLAVHPWERAAYLSV